jgi:hypothetical protein
MRRIAGSFGLWFAGFAAASSSAQLIVDPSFAGGFATIQPALDAAAPDQTILVMPGTYSGPIVITKPVKLLGIGMPEILHGAVPTGSWSSVWRCVELQGPGWGKVVLAGFKIGSPNACTWTAYPIYPCISGSGFEELHVVRCQVHGPIPGCLTGVAKGFPALRVVVPLVILAHSSLKGSPTLSDWVWPVPQAEPSVDVTGCVAILDSVVHGTAAEDPYWIVGLMGPAPPFPCPCPELMGNNSGSAGVKATLGFVVNSEISGGPGGKVVLSAPEGTFPYGSQPSGPAWTPGAE